MILWQGKSSCRFHRKIFYNQGICVSFHSLHTVGQFLIVACYFPLISCYSFLVARHFLLITFLIVVTLCSLLLIFFLLHGLCAVKNVKEKNDVVYGSPSNHFEKDSPETGNWFLCNSDTCLDLFCENQQRVQTLNYFHKNAAS